MAKISPMFGLHLSTSIQEDENDFNSWRIVRNDPYLCKDVTKDVLPKGYYRKNYMKSSTKVTPTVSQKSNEKKVMNYSNLLSELVVQL